MSPLRSRKLLSISLLYGSMLGGCAVAPRPQSAGATPAMPEDALAQSFVAPPNSARPRVWWHWMNGNVTKDGIRKDIEWMQRAGIGGLQNFDANLPTPKVVEKRLAFMTPEWQDAFRYAAGQAQANGLELTIASSAGWSETGGPWVEPKDAMKKVVWSETTLTGGRPFSGKLAVPPSTTGSFLDLPLVEGIAITKPKVLPTFYADIAVLAYRIPADKPLAAPATITSRGAKLDARPVFDGSLATGIDLPVSTPDNVADLTVSYDAPQTVRSLTLFIPDMVGAASPPKIFPSLESSTDGQGWRKVGDIAVSAVPTTISFAPVTARYFRVVMPVNPGADEFVWKPAPGVDDTFFKLLSGPRKTMKLAEMKLSAEPRVNQFETKAGFSLTDNYYTLGVGTDPAQGVPPAEVVDLTGRMRPDGSLHWTPPAGRWRVVRMGYSLIGKVNHPATDEATGLEVDKYDGRAVRAYAEHYLGLYRKAVGDDLIGARGIRGFLTDSIEVGAANWTPDMVAQFRKLRGYDPIPFLPVLTGAIIGSPRESNAFLYDYRRTLADLIASQHYGTLAEVAHRNGLTVYGEALELGRLSFGDDIDMRSHADIPMGALWTYRRDKGPRTPFLADMKGAASTAHLFGRNLVAAESMTSAFNPWGDAPADLRRIVDLEFASGINRPVIHTSVHQPLDDKVPGLSLLFFGQSFNRHETWAEMARPWIDYIARSSLMLQQGRFHADVAYFYGEEAPTVPLTFDRYLPDVPTHYGYDFVNSTALRDLLTVDGSDVVAPSGARYRMIYLSGTSDRMTLPMLRRVAALAEAGATIVGNAPTASPQLEDDAAEYRRIVSQLWSGQPKTRVGRGLVIAGKDIEGALGKAGVTPDFAYRGSSQASSVLFVHRKLDDGDIYYVNNRRNEADQGEARFRVTGKAPEIWRADTGTWQPVSYRTEGDTTVVSLDMVAEDSFFVVFRKPTTSPSAEVRMPRLTQAATLNGSWNVAFQPDRGAPASMVLPQLASLSTQAEQGVRYFSGVSTYTKTFEAPAGWKRGQPMMLDLGTVGDLAEVRVNGVLVGTAWHAPYRLDIARAARAGRNTLEIKVANLWVNRLIGDAQPAAKKITYTALGTYKADAPLRPSGLIGPVSLLVDRP
ncbi:glycoside hydrolase [Sphingomonas sp. PL-96]|uniref:glycosyl hydrolase n=1 Tax=Sphingomonas sp. PL-96 TaxID=2887201 RepID=UPI001E3ED8C1|nr:glycosyl hydrolase [Sphingomonas sp. PL-96]MCC2978241.1 glycoside hydrolase [Sphingomonas sp. PL-96]